MIIFTFLEGSHAPGVRPSANPALALHVGPLQEDLHRAGYRGCTAP
jgi:hypothetical protein